MLNRLASKMVSPSDEGEDKVFMAVEVQELLDKQRNKLNERFVALEDKLTAMNEKNAHPKVEELTPREKLNSEKAKVETPPKDDGPSLHAMSYEYPIQHVPMPHMNPSSSAPPMIDEFNYSCWKSCIRSYLRFVCVEIWGIVENGFIPVDEKCMTPK
jgi:hypothetical protein